jgi:hypothetical protein
MSRTNVYRDGKVHVCANLCDTCIFRPGNLMLLRPGRVESMVEEATRNEGAIVCHKTTFGQDERGEAVCRGFFEKYPTQALQIARRLGYIEFQEEVAR